ncbi:rod shape-determining protein MreD [Candidatus Ruthia magnifica str. Cm (Calyptogena magnifica)]|uniref:Rod shape-determining protein MreD n=1 Tax=Ruthia magnifica subsp. Calyptogena magnifica TaxID=413404 RepID=A1AX61_RUTMC|nr:rod shape-determining protein MreD [Candidatus Ruthturnera calyptogenae]ABL02518.1 rod shape-determining protein MreD [Candidatus Ruthia magnifica str. Cm (Calyptogena magnifica)]
MNILDPYIFLIKITFFALILSVIPLNDILLDASAFWLLLFYIYWLVYFPTKNKFFIALILGVLVDVLHGDILGQNALALIFSSLFISNVKQSFFVSNLSTQQIYVFISSSIYLAFFLLTFVLTQDFIINYYLFLAPFTSALAWPIVRFLLSKCKV